MASSLTPRNPYQRNENLGSARRGMGVKVTPRRNVLSAISNGEANDGASADGGDPPPPLPVVEFSGREDVERLLAEKMKGKSKTDFKGKSEQMSEYIKKLRACIRWFMDLEDGYLAEQEKLRSSMDSENTRHADLEGQLSSSISELRTANLELKTLCESLEESLNKEQSDKLLAVQSHEKEMKQRESAEASRDQLLVDLERVTQEANRFSEQLKMIQDTNKKLQEYNTSLQQYNSSLHADVSKSGETISKLQKEKSAMMETMTALKEHNSSLNSQLQASRASQQEAIRVKEELRKEVECLRAELKQVRDDRDSSVAQLNILRLELTKYKEQAGKSSKDCESLRVKLSALEETCNVLQEQNLGFQKEIAVANEKLKLADVTAIEAMTGYKEQKERLQYVEERLAYAESQIVEGDRLRKKLHNTILELKGNIRVFCRVRPLLFHGDSNSVEEASISYPTSVESAGRSLDLINQGQKLSFSYDKVFDHNASQEDVFVEISQLIQSALDGYKASMLEIYNETIRDLLAPSRPNSFEVANGKQYTIKHDSHGNTTVSELTVIDVFSIADVTSLLDKASHSRSVGRTQMNEQSSRSHFVFTLKIFGSNEHTGQQVQGVLNLIDLAGSERLAKSGSTGDRLKETQAINKSLSALSDVIFAIAKGDDHVPFRNSKLTYLLQPCLGGDSKTLMFVNISPEASSVGESICSLRFASRVNACEIGTPRRHT
ncbi:hypothetical protein PR202_ga18935 [Eleusine coracana subsp. coracana]|uniref:Kinesin-like protein n=1 Tax=Eleusine coracana subsp. coracana TaxID=191504 RepID=A0AAV5CTW2_ELECO|nr:hypothetical protein PR202_ga18935 [Eleusine coracana subsp. coracana]